MTRLPPAELLGGPCSCGATTTAHVARIAHCGPCAATVLELVRASLVVRRDGVGLGQQSGPLRPDWGAGWADLVCDVCSAGWTGPIGESCAWCEQRLEHTLAEQRRLLLRPELPERGDKRRTEALKAWAERLANFVEAGVLVELDADMAWKRETK